MQNHVKLSGKVKKVFKPFTINYTNGSDELKTFTRQGFIVLCKPAIGSSDLQEVLCECDSAKFNGTKENDVVDVSGYIRVDKWPVDDNGKALKKNVPLKENQKWETKTLVEVMYISKLSANDLQARYDAVNAAASGSFQ